MSNAPAEREVPAEDSIKVVCRFRPLNDSEEKAGSKFVVKFPNNGEENCLSIGVSTREGGRASLEDCMTTYIFLYGELGREEHFTLCNNENEMFFYKLRNRSTCVGEQKLSAHS